MRVLSAMLFVFLLSFMVFPELGFVSDELRSADVFLADSTYNAELGNLAPNPSFEDGETGPEYWEYWEYGDGTQFFWTNDSSRSGSYSIGIGNISVPYTVYFWRTTKLIPVNPSRNYVFSTWFKFEEIPDLSQSPELCIAFFDENKTSLGTGFGKTFGFINTDWCYKELDCRATRFTPDTAYVVLELHHIYTSSTSDVPVLFDDVHFSLRTTVVPDDYPTIQSAIDAADEGDTVFVRNGTYLETLFINKSISLVGENRENTIIDAGGAHEHIVQVINTENVRIANFTISNNFDYHGVYIENSTSCTVEDNYFVNVYNYGVYTTRAHSCWIQNNKWFGTWVDGIQLRDSDNCTVIGNQITAHIDQYGLWLHGSNNCRVHDNWIANCEDGLMIEHSEGCLVSNNLIENCSDYGIDIGYWVGGTFFNNTIRSHYCGVDAEGWYTQQYGYPNWTIHHNNFLNCTINARLSSGNGTWSGNCEGNYWDDYNGSDSDGDGIGDAPYAIFGGIDTDLFPLMNLYWSPSDIDHDLDVDIFDIVRVAAAYLSTPSDPHWNCHCDIVEPFGLIDLFDVVLMADSYGEEYHGP